MPPNVVTLSPNHFLRLAFIDRNNDQGTTALRWYQVQWQRYCLRSDDPSLNRSNCDRIWRNFATSAAGFKATTSNESSPITTRPELPPLLKLFMKHFSLVSNGLSYFEVGEEIERVEQNKHIFCNKTQTDQSPSSNVKSRLNPLCKPGVRNAPSRKPLSMMFPVQD